MPADIHVDPGNRVVPGGRRDLPVRATALTAHPGQALRRIGGRLSLARQAVAADRTHVNNARYGRVNGPGAYPDLADLSVATGAAGQAVGYLEHRFGSSKDE